VKVIVGVEVRVGVGPHVGVNVGRGVKVAVGVGTEVGVGRIIEQPEANARTPSPNRTREKNSRIIVLSIVKNTNLDRSV